MSSARVGISAAVVVLGLAYAAFILWERHWYRERIPGYIETNGAIRISGETHFREGCGVAIFELSEKTGASIQRQKLKFFELALRDSGDISADGGYEPWRETPIIERDESNALVLGMSCASLDPTLERQISDAAARSGSYFAMDPARRTLLVAPESRLAVFAYWE